MIENETQKKLENKMYRQRTVIKEVILSAFRTIGLLDRKMNIYHFSN